MYENAVRKGFDQVKGCLAIDEAILYVAAHRTYVQTSTAQYLRSSRVFSSYIILPDDQEIEKSKEHAKRPINIAPNTTCMSQEVLMPMVIA